MEKENTIETPCEICGGKGGGCRECIPNFDEVMEKEIEEKKEKEEDAGKEEDV
jgi:hypothetical protein